MKILFLDDDPLRHEVFAEEARAAGHEPYHADSIDEFAYLFSEHVRFDAVYLDHDLNDFGLKSMAGKVQLDGCDVARFLALRRFQVSDVVNLSPSSRCRCLSTDQK